MTDTLMLLVAGYPDPQTAQSEFDALVEQVKSRQISSRGMILVAKDADGKVTVKDTGDHLGRKGAGWGGGVGVLVGLFAPPLLASVAVGAVAGTVVGKFAGHKVRGAIESQVSEALKPGTAVVIGIFPATQRLAVERALPGAPLKSVVESDEDSIGELKSVLTEAMGKFTPDRTSLPIPDRTFGGVMGRTLRDSVPDWSFIPGPQAPDDAPNVLVILIDDAGYGSIDSFGGPVTTPNFTRVQNMGVTYNRFHVTAVCSPTRAALLTGRNQHRVGFGSIAEYPGPFPGYSASAPSPSTPDRSRATAPPNRGAARPSRGSCARTATSPADSASGT